jgi:hypothetical protein
VNQACVVIYQQHPVHVELHPALVPLPAVSHNASVRDSRQRNPRISLGPDPVGGTHREPCG